VHFKNRRQRIKAVSRHHHHEHLFAPVMRRAVHHLQATPILKQH